MEEGERPEINFCKVVLVCHSYRYNQKLRREGAMYEGTRRNPNIEKEKEKVLVPVRVRKAKREADQKTGEEAQVNKRRLIPQRWHVY